MAQVRQFAAPLAGRTLTVPENIEQRIQRTSQVATDWLSYTFTDNHAFSLTDNTVDATVTTFELDLDSSGVTISGAVLIDLAGIASTADRIKKIADVVSRSPARFSAKVESTDDIRFESYDEGIHPTGTIFAKVAGLSGVGISTIDNDLEIESINFGLPVIPEADLPTLDSKVSSGPLTGTVWYYFSYFDAKHAAEGPSIGTGVCPIKVTGLSEESVVLDISTMVANAPARATHIKIYRSQAFPDGTIDSTVNSFALIAFVGAGGTVEGPTPGADLFHDETADAQLSTFTLSGTRGTIPQDFQFVYTHDNRVWGVKGDVVRASNALNPDEWDSRATWVIGDEPGFELTGLVSQNETLVAFKKSSMYALFYETFPQEEMSIQRLLGNRGTINPKTIVDADGQTFSLDYQGIHVFENLAQPTPISGKINDFIKRMNLSAQDKFSAVRADNKVVFFVALDDDTIPKHAFVFDLDAFRGVGKEIRWWVYAHDTGVLDSTMFFIGTSDQKSLENSLVPVFIDANGQNWILEWFESEGVPSSLISDVTINTIGNSGGFGVVTIASQADGRGFDSAPPAQAYDATNLPVRLVLPDGELTDSFYVRTVNSNTSIQLDRSLTTAELTATRLLVGPIISDYESGEFDLDDVLDRKEARKGHLRTTPMPFPGGMELRFERDRSGPDFMTETFDDGKYAVTQDREGFVVPVGGALREGGRGLQDVPLSGRFHTLAYRFSNHLPNRPFRINSLEVEKHQDPRKRLPSN